MSEPDDKPRTNSRATLEILGMPGEEVSIFPETRLDAPPAAIFVGEVPCDGLLRLRVPRFPLVIIAAGFGKATVQFDADATHLQVDVRRTRSMS
ncbi:hypothetical protein D3C71_1535370 [compost metagenome]